MAVTFGIDISHHQDKALDLAQCRRDGCDFVFLKATEGATYVDAEFASNLAEAERAGLLVAAYCYQRASASAAAHVGLVRRTVPTRVPIILDVEANGGGVGLTRDIIGLLKAAGYKVPLLYIPRWYWQQIGSPSLAGLPPLWSSRYPDNRIGTVAAEWADVPPHYWNGYGGLSVAALQFTSSARIAGHQPIDANAIRGSRNDVAALLGCKPNPVSPAPAPVSSTPEDDIMQLRAGANRSASGDIPAGKSTMIVNVPTGQMMVHAVYFAGDKYPPEPRDKFDWKGAIDWGDYRIDGLRPWHIPVPAGATAFSIFWDLADDGREGSVTFR